MHMHALQKQRFSRLTFFEGVVAGGTVFHPAKVLTESAACLQIVMSDCFWDYKTIINTLSHNLQHSIPDCMHFVPRKSVQ